MSATAHADEHEHHRFQAHHFETTEQQFQAGKLGMWLFLATEVLFFSGMFCAYAVFRASHPEVFEKAAEFLNPTLGAANTLVLLASSLSVAWAVRCAQLGKQGGLLSNLIFTMVCAGIFMGVKAVEYSLKWKEGLLWRGNFTWTEGSHPDLTSTHEMLFSFGLTLAGIGAALIVAGLIFGATSVGTRWAFFALGATVLGAAGGCLIGNVYTAWEQHDLEAHGEHSEIFEDAHALGLEGVAEEEVHDEEAESEDVVEGQTDADAPAATVAQEMAAEYGGEGPKFPGVFFSIYYAMTGVHAIHILAGIGVFVWIVSRAARGHFEPSYYGPVEYTGLYWHLVDLIWIYLFPLLYLIR